MSLFIPWYCLSNVCRKCTRQLSRRQVGGNWQYSDFCQLEKNFTIINRLFLLTYSIIRKIYASIYSLNERWDLQTFIPKVLDKYCKSEMTTFHFVQQPTYVNNYMLLSDCFIIISYISTFSKTNITCNNSLNKENSETI